MKNTHMESAQPEKSRVRDEIQQQVQEFLRRGGRITVCGGERPAVGAAIGSVWQLRDESDLVQRGE